MAPEQYGSARTAQKGCRDWCVCLSRNFLTEFVKETEMSIFSLSERLRVFQCPNCNETIDVSAQSCRFCFTPIDSLTAETAADLLQRVNAACSEVDDIEVWLPGRSQSLLVARGKIAELLLILTFVFPVLEIRWWIRHGSIRSNDPDFVRAKKNVWRYTLISVALWLSFCAFGLYISYLATDGS